MSDPKNDLPHRPSAPQWRKRRRLDGRPRPRRAVAMRSRAPTMMMPPREAVTVPVHQRLGFRPAEFAALIGVSLRHGLARHQAGKIEVVDQNGIKIIPRSYAVKAGYITPDDDVTGPAHDTRRGQPRPHPVT